MKNRPAFSQNGPNVRTHFGPMLAWFYAGWVVS